MAGFRSAKQPIGYGVCQSRRPERGVRQQSMHQSPAQIADIAQRSADAEHDVDHALSQIGAGRWEIVGITVDAA